MSTVTYKRFAMWVMTHGAEMACEMADDYAIPGATMAKWLARIAPTGRV